MSSATQRAEFLALDRLIIAFRRLISIEHSEYDEKVYRDRFYAYERAAANFMEAYKDNVEGGDREKT